VVSVRTAFLLLALLLPGFRIMAAEEPRLTEILPDGGTVRVEGDRLNIFDREGRREGYGVRRGDGSWDLFRKDGSRLGTIQKGIGGQPDRVIVPKRGK
jgi:hypothetical protein